MKVYTASQVKKWDAFTILHEPVESVTLMERAANACFNWITQHFPAETNFHIFCGTGNNGGDGLVIAILLHQAGKQVSVCISGDKNRGSKDFTSNLARINTTEIPVTSFDSGSSSVIINKDDIVVDALFGTGLSRPLTGLNAVLVNLINSSGARVISIDMPSGLFADQSAAGHLIIKPQYTLTFQCYKPAFLFAENEAYTGNVFVLDIGLHPGFLQSETAFAEITEAADIRQLIKPRKLHSHKGNYGHALLAGGSYGKMGAILLAAGACLKTGCGLLSVHVPEAGNNIIQAALPEAMTENQELNEQLLPKYAAIGLGPGWGTSDHTQHELLTVLTHFKKPVVLDADALNCLSINKYWLQLLGNHTVITPHPKEFERLFGKSANDFERLALARENALLYQVFVILKGHYTAIVTPGGQVFFNSTGNPGMAKGGCGDVLTGIITGFLAQGYPITEACRIAVYLHGLAGDIAARLFSEPAMQAGDLVSNIGAAFLELTRENIVAK